MGLVSCISCLDPDLVVAGADRVVVRVVTNWGKSGACLGVGGGAIPFWFIKKDDGDTAIDALSTHNEKEGHTHTHHDAVIRGRPRLAPISN